MLLRTCVRASADFLAGFLEADACFCVVPNNGGSSWTCSMAISVREDDGALLERCRRCFGVGVLDRRRARGMSRPQVSWIVRRKADAARLADILGGRFRGRNALVLARWIEAVELWTARSYGTTNAVHLELRRLSDAIRQLRPYRENRERTVALPLSSSYLGGLITGEGSFTFSNARPRLIVHMRADETPLLSAVAAATGLGSLYMQPARASSARSVSWQVHRSRELTALVRWLDGLELAGRKLEQFRAWRPAALRFGHSARS